MIKSLLRKYRNYRRRKYREVLIKELKDSTLCPSTYFRLKKQILEEFKDL